MQHVLRVPDNVRDIKFRTAPAVVIHVMGEIDEHTAEQFCTDLCAAQTTGQSVVPVYISNSPGGCLHSFLACLAAIRASRVPIVTVAMGFAASAAAALFTCGAQRYICAETRLMVHSVSQVSGGGSVKASEAEIEAKETKFLNKRLCEIMSINIGKEPRFAYALLKRNHNSDVYFGAEQALTLGFATHRGLPTLVTRVRVESTLEMPPDAQEQARLWAQPPVLSPPPPLSAASTVGTIEQTRAAPASGADTESMSSTESGSASDDSSATEKSSGTEPDAPAAPVRVPSRGRGRGRGRGGGAKKALSSARALKRRRAQK